MEKCNYAKIQRTKTKFKQMSTADTVISLTEMFDPTFPGA